MTLFEYFNSQIGDISNPVQWVFMAFAVLWIVSDFLHVFFTAIFSGFKK